MTTLYQPTSLLDLPDELVVEVLRKYDAIRSDQPQSQAFRYKQKERDRQRVNRDNQAALHSVCAASRRLNRIGTPLLYSAFLGSTTLHGIGPLRSFCKTISTRNELGHHIHYVENRFSDYLGNNLLHDMEVHDADHIPQEYFYALRALIQASPNIEQLCVISIESEGCSFWGSLLLNDALRSKMNGHGFPKLKTLAFQTNTSGAYFPYTTVPCFSNIFSALGSAPALTQLRVSRAAFGSAIVSGGSFKNLRRLELVETTSSFDDIDQIVSSCECLEHFACHWALLRLSVDVPFIDILPGIIKHKDTLKTLCLVPRLVEFSSPDIFNIRFSSLCHLQVLTEATLSNYCVPDKYISNSSELPSIAGQMPSSLKTLKIVYFWKWTDTTLYSYDILSMLWLFTTECKQALPHLQEVLVHFKDGQLASDAHFGQASLGDVAALTEKFCELGIRFTLVGRLDVLDFI